MCLLSYILLIILNNVISYDLNQCLNPPLVANVNLEKLLGTWYGQYVGTKKEGEKKCITYTNQLVLDDNGRVIVNIHATWKVDNHNESTDIKSYPIKNTSASKIVWQNITRFGWLVNTDYLYCSWYICIPDHAAKGIAFITTKEKHPSKEIIKKSFDSLKNINFDISKSPVYPINWNQCD